MNWLNNLPSDYKSIDVSGVCLQIVIESKNFFRQSTAMFNLYGKNSRVWLTFIWAIIMKAKHLLAFLRSNNRAPWFGSIQDWEYCEYAPFCQLLSIDESLETWRTKYKVDQPSEQTDHAVPNSLKNTVNIRISPLVQKSRKKISNGFSLGVFNGFSISEAR